MNMFEKINSMNIDEFAEWLDKHGEFDGSPWINWFDKNYCKKCEPVNACAEGYYGNVDFAWCELNDKCKFFMDMDNAPDNKDIIKMWLESEME